LERFPQFLQQPVVFDGDDRLPRKIAEQRDLLVVEGVDLLPENGNRTDELVVLKHRYRDKRADARKVR
jgi:hypothetical protein